MLQMQMRMINITHLKYFRSLYVLSSTLGCGCFDVRLHHHVLRRRAVPRLASPHRNPCRHSFPTVQKNKKCKTKSIATTPNSDSRFVCSTAGCTVPNAVGCANGGLQTQKRVQPYRSQSTWTNRSTSSNRCRLDWRLRMQLQSRPTQFK